MIEENSYDYINLPEATILNSRYLIESPLAERSNLSIVYLGSDIKSEKKVVIKEFFPKDLALRDLDGKGLVIKNRFQRREFQKGKLNFFNESNLIERLSNEHITDFYDYFEENGTGYIVMKYYEGETLEEYLINNKVSLSKFLKEIYLPLLKAVNHVHKKGYIHRDIKPENIMISEGKPILIDFGSALKYTVNNEKIISLTPGFSPIELYSSRAKQGPYSDIYSLAAILYYYLIEEAPDDALDRIIEDRLISRIKSSQECSNPLMKLILNNLSVNYKDRSKSIGSFSCRLRVSYYLNRIMKKVKKNSF